MPNIQAIRKAEQDKADNALLKSMPSYDADTWPATGVNKDTVIGYTGGVNNPPSK